MNQQADFDAFLIGLMEAKPTPAPSAVIFTTTRKSPPHFYRCRDCCEVFTTDAPLAGNTVCACDSKRLESLGQPRGDVTVRIENRCPCDARCTYATGPNCDCVCLGANHGTGRVVQVAVITGAVPKLQLSDPAAAANRRAEFLEECNKAEQRLAITYGAHWSNFIAGRWIDDREAWAGCHYGRKAISDARKLKVHKNRIAAVRKVCSQ